MHVEVIGPRIEDRPLIRNLYTFYRYDLMPFIARGPGSCVNEFGTIDGETSRTHEEAVRSCDIWWEKPRELWPLLIRADGRPAGFVLLNATPHVAPGVDRGLCELFVLNKYRRQGIASRAAVMAMDRFPGRWEVAYLTTNSAAAAFWGKLIPAYTRGRHRKGMIQTRPDEPPLEGLFFDNSIGNSNEHQ